MLIYLNTALQIHGALMHQRYYVPFMENKSPMGVFKAGQKLHEQNFIGEGVVFCSYCASNRKTFSSSSISYIHTKVCIKC